MKKLRNKFERFCYQNRHKGIPNLMLYVVLGSAIVFVMSQMDRSNVLYNALCFDRAAILQGQVWRLFTYVFTFNRNNVIMTLIGLMCYYSLGRSMENSWGTLRFNLFYFTGVVLMDIFGMIFSSPYFLTFQVGSLTYYLPPEFYQSMGTYLNLSLFLGYATLYPQSHFLLFFIIPVKAWIFGLFYLGILLFDVIQMSFPIFLFPHNLFPLVALANYFLFFGSDILNIFPMSWRINARRLFKKKPPKKTGTVVFQTAGSYEASTATVKTPYTHRCTVCGRTDVSHPDLEFRYCSRCSGYHCYCQDHINNHSHIQ